MRLSFEPNGPMSAYPRSSMLMNDEVRLRLRGRERADEERRQDEREPGGGHGYGLRARAAGGSVPLSPAKPGGEGLGVRGEEAH